jgi:hypothetical protein
VIPELVAAADDFHNWSGVAAETAAALPKIVHLSSLAERRSRASSLENAEVELEHDQLECRSRIAWQSERLAAGAELTAQIRPERKRFSKRSAWLLCLRTRQPGSAAWGAC